MGSGTGMNTETSAPSSEPASASPSQASDQRGLSKGAWIGIGMVALIVAIAVVFGILARSSTEHSLATETKAAAIPSVNVIYPVASTLSSEIALPGNVQAFTDTPIYSRTNGYLKSWYFDIGAHVKKGQLMAQI